jgi:hypothetical protein
MSAKFVCSLVLVQLLMLVQGSISVNGDVNDGNDGADRSVVHIIIKPNRPKQQMHMMDGWIDWFG